MSAFEQKSFQLMMLFALILFVQFIAQMIWGHFGGLVKIDELQEPKYFPRLWVESELISEGIFNWAKEKVQKRLSEIRYHLQGLGSLREGQVPEHIQARLKEEEHQLRALILGDSTKA